ncbi:trypsin-like peptidase domain-containing protein [Streptomyces sp. NPDC001093]|uniref:VMAP-C domain-containing protein n=1 Tax=Streptomyces sp. NPDC001093 TaxID=3154376 RepID=UPI003317A3B7
MGWFRQDGPPGPVVSVLKHAPGDTAKASVQEAGAAVLLSPRQVLTCAHVVNDALGLPLLATEWPTAHGLDVMFHVTGAPRRTAHVSVWVPPRSAPSGMWQGDLCVLELADAAPEQVRPVVWLDMTEGQQLRAWGGDGAVGGFADTEAKLADQGVYYLDGLLSGGAIAPGFSGGPLWVRNDTVAVGLVVAHHHTQGPLASQQVLRRSWALPWQTIRAELRASGAGELIDSCVTRAPATCEDTVGETLSHALWRLLADPVQRADHACRLASQLGYGTPADGSPPSVDELVTLLTTVERALATLTESLSLAHGEGPRPEALNQLLAAGRLSGMARLLSVAEYHGLVERLKQVAASDPALLPRAAREALRYTPLPLTRRAALSPEGVEAAVGELEELSDGDALPDGGPSVPALLKLVEFTAAALAAPLRDELTAWNERASRRLGVHRAALAQRRGDALAWAAQRPAPVVRLVAEIGTLASDPADHHRLRLWQVDADGTPRPVVPEDAWPRTAGEIGRLIREAAERASADSGHVVKDIEIQVDRDGLHLPIDEWDTGGVLEWLPGEPLGVPYRVSLRCPDLTSRNARLHATMLRARWSEAGVNEPLVVDEQLSDPRRLVTKLRTSHEGTSQVVLHGSAEIRSVLLEVCLACGVPVILWDRAAESYADARNLEEVRPAGPLFELPERVRRFRGDFWGDPVRHPARPALVWEPEEPLALPSRPRLVDPAEGVRS